MILPLHHFALALWINEQAGIARLVYRHADVALPMNFARTLDKSLRLSDFFVHNLPSNSTSHEFNMSWLKSLFGSKHTILVSIPVPDTFPDEADLNARNAIMDSLDAQRFGSLVGAGGGFNQMDFEYKVADIDRAKEQIAKAMSEFLPGREYNVIVE